MPKNNPGTGLPARWRYLRGAYYYSVPPGMERHWDDKVTFRLGKTLSEAYCEWSKRVTMHLEGTTVGNLLDRYLIDVVPHKAPKTQTDNLRQIKMLRSVFGEVMLTHLRPQDIYKYHDCRSGKTAAKREIEVLSHAFTMAVAWGLIPKHPFKGEVRIAERKPRTRYVEDWEIQECLSIKGHRRRGSISMVQAYIRIKLMTGMARGDLLRLKPSQQFTEEGILIQRHKTANTSGKRTLYRWTQDLRDAIALAQQVKPIDDSLFLFCRTDGTGYFDEDTGEAKAWDNVWQNFMERLLTDTKVQERFTEHDLRAKCASDAETLEQARALLSHADSRLTDRVYRRKAEIVEPLKGLKKAEALAKRNN